MNNFCAHSQCEFAIEMWNFWGPSKLFHISNIEGGGKESDMTINTEGIMLHWNERHPTRELHWKQNSGHLLWALKISGHKFRTIKQKLKQSIIKKYYIQ